MSRVHVDITMSLDGFIAGPNDEIDPLHDWLYGLASWREPHGLPGGTADRDAEVLAEAMGNNGAVIVGRRMYDLAGGWGENPPFHVPVFVLTRGAREPLAKAGGTTFTFVTDGIESALAQAREAAGDRDVSVGGGANTIQQYLRAGLIDEMQIHIAPVLLGEGIRLFEQGTEGIELEITRVIGSPKVAHLRFRVVK
ncbi:MAG: dihydrofolate reductase family protein [Actinomycetota bacterium]